MRKRLYYAVEGGKYVNYLSLLTDNPIRLNDTPFIRSSNPRKGNFIIYTEMEARRLLRINKKVAILEVFREI